MVALHQSHVQLDLSRGFEVGLASPLSIAAGATYRADTYQLEAGEEASYIDGGGQAAPAAQVFLGFRPDQEVDETRTSMAIAERSACMPRRRRT